mgnify:CR=1 FL=1
MRKTLLSNPQERLVLGTVILTTCLGLGSGLIISAFIKTPINETKKE